MNPGHLERIRKLPCIACGADPCGEAAHVRMTSLEYGKDNPGIGSRPGDDWAVPLCHRCHMDQHARGERAWWQRLGIDPLELACSLWLITRFADSLEAMRLEVIKRSR